MPCSGGGLVAGCALAIKAEWPDCAVYAVEPRGFEDTAASLAAGERRRSLPGGTTLCDGLRAPTPGAITFAINRRELAGALAVDDEQIRAAMAVAAQHLKVVVEPSGAAALAAVLARAAADGQCVAVVLSGGNVDADLVRRRAANPRRRNDAGIAHNAERAPVRTGSSGEACSCRQIARLDDWYRFDDAGPLFITGLQALVRLLLAQSHRDRLAGLNTAGFVSGYRGSPLGGLDRELWRAGKYLDAAQIRFQPGLNEDLAATSIWGAQQANLFAGARYDGVFGMWYGKGPGVDRSGDPFKHGNAAGTSRYGGVHRGRRRRPHLQVVVAAAPERVRVHRCVDAGAEPGQRRGDRRARALRLRAVALQRLLGRAQGHAGDGRRDAELRAVAAGADRS